MSINEVKTFRINDRPFMQGVHMPIGASVIGVTPNVDRKGIDIHAFCCPHAKTEIRYFESVGCAGIKMDKNTRYESLGLVFFVDVLTPSYVFELIPLDEVKS